MGTGVRGDAKEMVSILQSLKCLLYFGTGFQGFNAEAKTQDIRQILNKIKANFVTRRLASDRPISTSKRLAKQVLKCRSEWPQELSLVELNNSPGMAKGVAVELHRKKEVTHTAGVRLMAIIEGHT